MTDDTGEWIRQREAENRSTYPGSSLQDTLVRPVERAPVPLWRSLLAWAVLIAACLVAWAVAALFGAAVVHGVQTSGFDWDEILVVCMAVAGFAYVVDANRRTSKLDDYAIDLTDRVSRVETRLPDVDFEARLRERVEERVASNGERITVCEEQLRELRERLAREFETAAELEARLGKDEDEG